jgi:hypothetical protein
VALAFQASQAPKAQLGDIRVGVSAALARLAPPSITAHIRPTNGRVVFFMESDPRWW